MVAVYAIVNGNADGWTSGSTLVRFAVALGLFVSFLAIETRVASPLMPLGLFRRRNLSTASVTGILWAGAMFAWFFLSALYLQLVLGYSPLQVGLGFLPGNLVMGFLLHRRVGEARDAVRRTQAARGRAASSRASGSCCSRVRRSTAATSSMCCPE